MYDFNKLYEPQNLKEALKLRKKHPEAVIIAGGSDVLIKMREGKLAGCDLLSIQFLDELRGVKYDDNNAIRIGSLNSFSSVTFNEIIDEKVKTLGEAVDMVGGPQIRNIGTIGGNVSNGVTSADSASTLFAYDAKIELSRLSKDGKKIKKRVVPIQEFYIWAGQTDVKEGELVTAIIIEEDSYKDTYGKYIKYAMRNALDIATLGCSVNVRLSADKKTFERVRIAFGVAGPIPLRAEHAEKFAKGKEVSEENVAEIAKTIMEDIKPRDSWRASKAFRSHIAQEICKRALTKSIRRAGGAI